MINYELTPYPMFLFNAKNILHQPDKAILAEVIRNYVSSKSGNAVTQTAPGTGHHVLDGGSCLHHLEWMEKFT